jgi:hypothetical protein
MPQKVSVAIDGNGHMNVMHYVDFAAKRSQ